MQNIVIDKPYEFIPPCHAEIWTWLVKKYVRRYMRKVFAVHTVECRKTERLAASVEAGHGILIAPNHCRMCDPFVLGEVAKKLKISYYAMVSWHAFNQDWFSAWMIRKLGGFSVYREGMDRRSLDTAIEILVTARRPLIVFPEGALSRHNDQLMALMDGVAFMARTAAKRRAKKEPPGKVVIHPTAIRYYFRGNLEKALSPVLDEIESHFAWRPRKGRSLISRIRAIGEGCLALKEIEYFGHARTGDIYERVDSLIDHVLLPLEEEWDIRDKATNVVGRVKDLRSAILRDMVNGGVPEEERERRWQQLAACYYAQQMSHYPRDYVSRGPNVPEHVLETVERLEEDLTDNVRVHGPLHAIVEMGEAIEVSPVRDRRATTDPLMEGIESQLKTMLAGLAAEAPRF